MPRPSENISVPNVVGALLLLFFFFFFFILKLHSTAATLRKRAVKMDGWMDGTPFFKTKTSIFKVQLLKQHEYKTSAMATNEHKRA